MDELVIWPLSNDISPSIILCLAEVKIIEITQPPVFWRIDQTSRGLKRSRETYFIFFDSKLIEIRWVRHWRGSYVRCTRHYFVIEWSMYTNIPKTRLSIAITIDVPSFSGIRCCFSITIYMQNGPYPLTTDNLRYIAYLITAIQLALCRCCENDVTFMQMKYWPITSNSPVMCHCDIIFKQYQWKAWIL